MSLGDKDRNRNWEVQWKDSTPLRNIGPVRFSYSGDANECKALMGFGRKLLGAVKHGAAMAGIDDAWNRVVLPSGAQVFVASKGGIDQVHVVSGAKSGAGERYVPHGFIVYPKDEANPTGFYFPNEPAFDYPIEHPYPPIPPEGETKEPIPDYRKNLAALESSFSTKDNEWKYTVKEKQFLQSGNQFYFPRKEKLNALGQPTGEWVTTGDVYSWWHSPAGDYALSDREVGCYRPYINNGSLVYTSDDNYRYDCPSFIYKNGKTDIVLEEAGSVISGFAIKSVKVKINNVDTIKKFFILSFTNIVTFQIKMYAYFYNAELKGYGKVSELVVHTPTEKARDWSWPCRFDYGVTKFAVLNTEKDDDDNDVLVLCEGTISDADPPVFGVEKNIIPTGVSTENSSFTSSGTFNDEHDEENPVYYPYPRTTLDRDKVFTRVIRDSRNFTFLGTSNAIPYALNYDKDGVLIKATLTTTVDGGTTSTSNQTHNLHLILHHAMDARQFFQEKTVHTDYSYLASSNTILTLTIKDLSIPFDFDVSDSSINTLMDSYLLSEYNNSMSYSGGNYSSSGSGGSTETKSYESSLTASEISNRIEFHFIDVVSKTFICNSLKKTVNSTSNETISNLNPNPETYESSYGVNANGIEYYIYEDWYDPRMFDTFYISSHAESYSNNYGTGRLHNKLRTIEAETKVTVLESKTVIYCDGLLIKEFISTEEEDETTHRDSTISKIQLMETFDEGDVFYFSIPSVTNDWIATQYTYDLIIDDITISGSGVSNYEYNESANYHDTNFWLTVTHPDTYTLSSTSSNSSTNLTGSTTVSSSRTVTYPTGVGKYTQVVDGTSTLLDWDDLYSRSSDNNYEEINKTFDVSRRFVQDPAYPNDPSKIIPQPNYNESGSSTGNDPFELYLPEFDILSYNKNDDEDETRLNTGTPTYSFCLDERYKSNQHFPWLSSLSLHARSYYEVADIHYDLCHSNYGPVRLLPLKPESKPHPEFTSDTLTLHPIGLY